MSRFARQFARRGRGGQGKWRFRPSSQTIRRQHYILLTDEKGQRRGRLGWIDEDVLANLPDESHPDPTQAESPDYEDD